MVDLVSEGPCVGLADGAKSIFLNDTPLQSASGQYNFSGVTYQTVEGYPDQDVIPGYPNATTVRPLNNVPLTAGVAIVRTITDSNADAALVLLRMQAMTELDTETGDLHGSSVQLQVFVTPTGAPKYLARSITISGKAVAPYEEQHRIELPAGGAPWDIEVVRTTADPATSNINNYSFWTALTEVIDAKFIYPDTAAIGTAFDSELFGGQVATRAFDYIGRILDVPSNYNPTTREYTGIWDGTFKQAWTDNPAWALRDLLINDRYGLGETIDVSAVDKWAFYSIAQYCDELVDDGFGGHEPRYTLNYQIRERVEAYQLLGSLATAFQGMLYWANGAVTATQDAPADPVKLVSRANIIGGEPVYSGTALKARHTVALVTWFDPADNYRRAIEVVEDVDAIARYGWRETSFVAYGCTSRGQAVRFGKWRLDTEHTATDTVTYSVGLDHADVRPGDIIALADDQIAGARFGGRVKSASAAPAGDYFAGVIAAGPGPLNDYPYIVSQDGTGRYTVDRNGGGYSTAMGWVTVATEPGKPYRLTLPNMVRSHWSRIAINGVLSDNVDTADFVAVGVETALHFSATNSGVATVSFDVPTLVRTDPTLITLDQVPDIGDVSGWSLMVTLPDQTVETVQVLAIAGDVVTVPDTLPDIPSAQALWILTSGMVEPRQWRVLLNRETDDHTFEITALEHDPQKYGRVEQGLVLDPPSFTTIPSGDLPSPPSVAVEEYLYTLGPRVSAGMIISWTPPADPRVSYYRVDIKGPGDPEFATRGWPSSNTLDLRDVRDGTYEIRIWTIDALGRASPSYRSHQHINKGLLAAPADPQNLRLSVNSQHVILTWLGVLDLDLSHYEIRYSPVTAGASWENMQVVVSRVAPGTTTVVLPARRGTYAVKAVDQSGVYSDAAAFAVSTSVELAGVNIVETLTEAPNWTGTKVDVEKVGTALRLTESVEGEFPASGSYLASQQIDLGASYPCRLSSLLEVSGDNIDNVISSWGSLAEISAISGTNPSQWSIASQMRTSDDMATWTEWRDLLASEATARGFEFRLQLESVNAKVTPNVDAWTVTVDMPDRVERAGDVACPVEGKSVVYAPAFIAKPVLAIDGQDMQSGDTYERSAESATGFTLIFKNSSGTPVARTFDWIAVGHGRRQ